MTRRISIFLLLCLVGGGVPSHIKKAADTKATIMKLDKDLNNEYLEQKGENPNDIKFFAGRNHNC